MSSSVNMQYWFILIRKFSVTRALLLSDYIVCAAVFSEPPCVKTMLCQTSGCFTFVDVPAEMICSGYSKCKHIQWQNKPKAYLVLVRKYS